MDFSRPLRRSLPSTPEPVRSTPVPWSVSPSSESRPFSTSDLERDRRFLYHGPPGIVAPVPHPPPSSILSVYSRSTSPELTGRFLEPEIGHPSSLRCLPKIHFSDTGLNSQLFGMTGVPPIVSPILFLPFPTSPLRSSGLIFTDVSKSTTTGSVARPYSPPLHLRVDPSGLSVSSTRDRSTRGPGPVSRTRLTVG